MARVRMLDCSKPGCVRMLDNPVAAEYVDQRHGSLCGLLRIGGGVVLLAGFSSSINVTAFLAACSSPLSRYTVVGPRLTCA